MNAINILSGIVASKKIEISNLHKRFNIEDLKTRAESMSMAQPPLFYLKLEKYRADNSPFFIAEFKRKSPSEGWIAAHADLKTQLDAYTYAGAAAISVLTDEPFFGGTYDDLQQAAAHLAEKFNGQPDKRPLLLQKDFVLDPIQIYQAKIHGADLILLIAAILSPEQLEELFLIATTLDMGVLVEVHDAEELDAIKHIPFPVLGINNRDLRTFRTALNRVNVFKSKNEQRFLVSESSILDYRHFQMVRKADAFLIGTGLMRAAWGEELGFEKRFRTNGQKLFKACGLRTQVDLENLLASPDVQQPDYIGVNFSPVSRRRCLPQILEDIQNPAFWDKAVAVFYKNETSEIRDTLDRLPFKTIQIYADDQPLDFVRSLKQRVLLAIRVTEGWLNQVDTFAPFVDCFILDGALPGSGQPINQIIPADFPYPFFLAGGINLDNLNQIDEHPACIGADIASGIENNAAVDLNKIIALSQRIHS